VAIVHVLAELDVEAPRLEAAERAQQVAPRKPRVTGRDDADGIALAKAGWLAGLAGHRPAIKP
jgi:hypothetical protein